MAKTSPTKRTLDHMRKQGYLCDVVEKTIRTPTTQFKRDLFGFVDVLCLRDDEIVAVQATSDNGGNVSSRIKKIESDELAEKVAAVRKAGIRIVVQGWRKKGHRWQVREVDLS